MLGDTQLIVLATTRDIEEEWRCWMVDGELVAASLYKRKGRRAVEAVSSAELGDLRSFVERRDRQFRPHPCYVVDVCSTPAGEMRVVEYNCYNCSGRYAGDRAAIFSAALAYASRASTAH